MYAVRQNYGPMSPSSNSNSRPQAYEWVSAMFQATREFLDQVESEPQAGFWSDGSPMAISPALRTGVSSATPSPAMAPTARPPQQLPALAGHATTFGETTSGPVSSAGQNLAQAALGSVCNTAGIPKGAATCAQAADSAAQASPLEAYKAAVAAARARSRAAAAARAPAPAALPHQLPDRQAGNGYPIIVMQPHQMPDQQAGIGCSVHVMQPVSAQGQVPRPRSRTSPSLLLAQSCDWCMMPHVCACC